MTKVDTVIIIIPVMRLFGLNSLAIERVESNNPMPLASDATTKNAVIISVLTVF
jgi:hypothetical protein